MDVDCSHEIKRHLLLGRKAITNLGSILKSRDITLRTKVHRVIAMVSSEVMYGCESWTIKRLKNWSIWTAVLEKTLESPLDCKEIKPVNPKGNQSWIFIGWTDAKAETLLLWPLDEKSQLILKNPWCWEGLKAESEGDDRVCDGWMTLSTQRTWVWVNSERY